MESGQCFFYVLLLHYHRFNLWYIRRESGKNWLRVETSYGALRAVFSKKPKPPRVMGKTPGCIELDCFSVQEIIPFAKKTGASVPPEKTEASFPHNELVLINRQRRLRRVNWGEGMLGDEENPYETLWDTSGGSREGKRFGNFAAGHHTTGLEALACSPFPLMLSADEETAPSAYELAANQRDLIVSCFTDPSFVRHARGAHNARQDPAPECTWCCAPRSQALFYRCRDHQRDLIVTPPSFDTRELPTTRARTQLQNAPGAARRGPKRSFTAAGTIWTDERYWKVVDLGYLFQRGHDGWPCPNSAGAAVAGEIQTRYGKARVVSRDCNCQS
ncbi:hypothetical protein C8R46DRAFT_1035848 [Mycena filopes]|nr:hypothetical protein C8R46DRAFT_1035848 [Mycena filopes]